MAAVAEEEVAAAPAEDPAPTNPVAADDNEGGLVADVAGGGSPSVEPSAHVAPNEG